MSLCTPLGVLMNEGVKLQKTLKKLRKNQAKETYKDAVIHVLVVQHYIRHY